MKKAEVKNAELEISSGPTPCANRMAHKSRPIHLSISRIAKEVPGRTLATFGSAWVLEWPPELMERIDYQATTYRAKTTNQTFLVTTSEVLTNSDVTSPAACQADFLRVNLLSTKTFRLNKVPLHEVQISGQTDHNISLTLVPTEPLHNQRMLSSILRNEFQVDRPQVCDTCKESDILEDGPDMLYCYVMCENRDKSFYPQCYAIEKDDQNKLFFLRSNGNKTKLRSLQDFDRTEYPNGSIILNKRGVVGFLAFDENDEILPLFLLQCRAVDDHFEELAPSRSKDTEVGREVRRKFNTLLNPAANENQDELDDSQIRAPSNSLAEMEDSHEDLRSTKNVKLSGKKNQPSEGPYFESVEAGDRYEERRNRDYLKGGQYGIAANEPLRRSRQRRQSEEAFAAPRTARSTLRKCYSEEPILPLKSGDHVNKVIYCNVYVMDTLARCLDTSYKNVQYWLHLAYRRGVSQDSILALKRGSPESCSEELFQVVSTVNPSLSIATLIGYLEELDMNDVVKCIQDVNLNENMHMRVDKLLESGEVPGRFYTLLDQKPEEKWNELGMNLGLDGPTLKRIKIHCANRKENPAENLIEIICAAKPTMTIGQFKKHLEKAKRKDVWEKLDSLPAKKYLTIMDVRDDLNLTRELSSMLNDRDKHVTFKDLADECGITSEIYRSLQPPCTESPTVEVMKDILGRNPCYTVDELFTDLRDMDRIDAVEMISRHFKEEDTRVLKRELRISDE